MCPKSSTVVGIQLGHYSETRWKCQAWFPQCPFMADTFGKGQIQAGLYLAMPEIHWVRIYLSIQNQYFLVVWQKYQGGAEYADQGTERLFLQR